MRYGKFILLGSLALAALLVTTSSEANARVYGRGYGGGYGRGISVGVGFGRGYGGYGGYGYNRGYGGYGYNRGYGGYGYRGVGIGLGLGLGLGGYGLGFGNGYYGSGYYSPSYYNSGYAYSPSYSSYSYVPNYSYAPEYNDAQSPDYSIQANPSTPSATTQQSLYYSPPQTDNSAQIRVLVPAGAQVWVGGALTSQTGSERVFASPAIQPGRTYTYEVKARWMQEGEPVEQVKQVRVQANQTTTVDFSPLVEKQ